jgi:hypothetical protein
VKLWKGLDYTITKPRDLFVAWNDVMFRISNRGTIKNGQDRNPTITGFASKK